jgi:hypothetical protein
MITRVLFEKRTGVPVRLDALPAASAYRVSGSMGGPHATRPLGAGTP